MNARWLARVVVAGLACGAAAPTTAQGQAASKAIYEASCAGCHGPGILGAPKFGDSAQWAPRAKAGIDALVKSAVAGTAKGMPPKGGRADLSEAQLRGVIEYMMGSGVKAAAAAPAAKAPPAVTAAPASTAAPRTAAAPAPTPPPAAQAAGATPQASPAKPGAPAIPSSSGVPLPVAQPTAPPAMPPAMPPAPTPTATATALARAAPTPAPSAEVNAFNRLLKPPARINRPAVESGIHDPANDMTLQLQPPALAFSTLPKSQAGNHVDWVKSLDGKAIEPRWDRLDPAAQAIVMDLNIVREVKGSMPDVVYPHKQHTEWLDCSNCHPKIFAPQKGANQMSMASILLGQQCGVCHGKVAFPVSECRLCHSRKKAAATVAGEAKP